jgi:hypothetical protein
MAEQLHLTSEESDNLRAEVLQVRELLKKDIDAQDNFFKSPFRFLLKKFNILLLGYFERSVEIINDFNRSVRKVFSRAREVFSDCFACKFSSLIIIYGLLAKFGYALAGFIEVIDQIVSKLQDFFGDTSESAEHILQRLKHFSDQLKPSTLALKFCQDIKMCSPVPLTPEFAKDAPAVVQVPAFANANREHNLLIIM